MTSSPINPDVLLFLKSELGRITKTSPEDLSEGAAMIDLGLQSIDAVIMSGNIEDRFEIEFDLEMIFDHDTLGSFASAITEIISST